MTASTGGQNSLAAQSQARRVRYVTPEELYAKMEAGDAPVILDIRREEGYTQQPYQIPGALRFRLDVRPPAVPSLPRSTPLVVYCT